jgi:hypothetical protein
VNPIRAKLLGESVREIGVLVLVFVPLDVLLQAKGLVDVRYPAWMDGNMDWCPVQDAVVISFLLVGVLMLYFGIKIETKATVELEATEGGSPQ